MDGYSRIYKAAKWLDAEESIASSRWRRESEMASEPVSGVVRSIAFHPGREDGLLAVDLGTEEEQVKTVRLRARDPDAFLKFNGMEVDFGELMMHLAERVGEIRVTLWPEDILFGVAVRGEFTGPKSGVKG